MNGILYMNIEIFENQMLFDKSLSLISDKRKEEIKKYKNAVPARLSLGAGILLRIAMERCGVADKLNDIEYGEQGKPYLRDSEFYFSLSHSGDYAVCVFGDTPLGADLQKIKMDIPEHTKRILSNEETIYLNSLEEQEKKEVFYRLWARKESLIKWDGRGLRLPLQHISLVEHNGFMESLIFEKKTVYFQESHLFMPEYTFCICSEKEFMIGDVTEITSNFLTKY